MATRTLIEDLDPKTKDWIERAQDEHLRRHGRFRDLVLRMIAPVEEVHDDGVFETRIVRHRRPRADPTREEIIAACNESSDPLPTAIVDYIVKHYVKELPRKTGPKMSTRSTWFDVMVIAFYQHQLSKARQRHAAGLEERPATRAKVRTAKKFGLSPRTVDSITQPRRPLLNAEPK